VEWSSGDEMARANREVIMATERCYVCGRGNPDTLESHHTVPQRYGGSDDDENITQLCPNCHEALERLYDDDFYQRLKQSDLFDESENSVSGLRCGYNDCTSRDTTVIEGPDIKVAVCDVHSDCSKYGCDDQQVVPVLSEDGERWVACCSEHRICWHGDCGSRDVRLIDIRHGDAVLCYDHIERYKDGWMVSA